MISVKSCFTFIGGGYALRPKMICLKDMARIEKILFIWRWCSSECLKKEATKGIYGFERVYFRNVMKNSSKYPACNFSPDALFNEKCENALVLGLRSVANGGGNAEDVPPVDGCKSDAFTVDDLIELYHLLSVPSVQSIISFDVKHFSSLFERKSDFASKISENLSKYLALLHIMVKVDKRVSNVYYYIVKTLQRRWKYMTNSQIIEFFYFLHFYKGTQVQRETQFELEKVLADKITDFTLDELAVIAYGLFRGQVHPGSLLSKAIAQQIENNIVNCNEVQASVFSKVSNFLHYCGRRNITENVHQILTKCVSLVDKFTLTTAIHMSCAGISVNVENRQLLNSILKRMKAEFNGLRLKDIERLLLACLYANVELSKESELICLIEKRLDVSSYDVQSYPRSFLSLVQYLIMYGIYFDHLIDFALSPQCFEKLPKSSMKNKLHELLFIDISLEIERPNYTGNRLSDIQRKKISKRDMHITDYNEISSSIKWNKEIVDKLNNIFGENRCRLKRLLINYATFHPVLCLNEKMQAQDVGQKLQELCHTFVKAPRDGNQWICFIIIRRQGCLSDGVTLNLISHAKLRQFKAAGYIPLTVLSHVWAKKSPEEKDSYLRKILQNAINNGQLNNVIDVDVADITPDG